LAILFPKRGLVYIIMENNSDTNDTDVEIDRLRQILNNKINQKKNEIHPSHNKVYNNSLQQEIDCLKWVLGQTTNTTTIKNQRQIQINKIKDVVQNEVNKLETTLTTKSLSMRNRDMFIIYTDILQWVLYIIQSIKEKGLHWQFNI
jgi:hypothetical protein